LYPGFFVVGGRFSSNWSRFCFFVMNRAVENVFRGIDRILEDDLGIWREWKFFQYFVTGTVAYMGNPRLVDFVVA
jgi:hypothetical protein